MALVIVLMCILSLKSETAKSGLSGASESKIPGEGPSTQDKNPTGTEISPPGKADLGATKGEYLLKLRNARAVCFEKDYPNIKNGMSLCELSDSGCKHVENGKTAEERIATYVAALDPQQLQRSLKLVLTLRLSVDNPKLESVPDPIGNQISALEQELRYKLRATGCKVKNWTRNEPHGQERHIRLLVDYNLADEAAIEKSWGLSNDKPLDPAALKHLREEAEKCNF